MISSEIKQHIHKLIDNADDNQLDAVLEVLEPSSPHYTVAEINSFYKRVEMLDNTINTGYSIEQSHSIIRNKTKHSGL